MGVEVSRIAIVMSACRCKRHGAGLNEPCWVLPARDGQQNNAAVCGNRVKSAGFNGGYHGPAESSTGNHK